MEKLEYPLLNMPPELLRAKLQGDFAEPPRFDEPAPQPWFRNDGPAVNTAPDHTAGVFDARAFPKIVDWAAQVMRDNRYEALAGCGHSGLLVIGAVCHKLGIPAIAVRKDGDPTKGMCAGIVNAILPRHGMTYAFIDDLVASGGTFLRVVTQIQQHIPDLKLAGVLLYRGGYMRESLLDQVGAPDAKKHSYVDGPSL